MAVVTGWKFVNPDVAQVALRLSGDPLGAASIDPKPVGLQADVSQSFDSADTGAKLSVNARGEFTVAALNDAKDPDEDGILSAETSDTAEGALPPQITFNPAHAWLKYRATAGLKAEAGVDLGDLVGVDAAADASVVVADYRRHARSQTIREAFFADIASGARFVTNLEHVAALAVGEALAFRFTGSVRATVTISWSDIFTGQIGTLAKAVGSAVPITLSIKAGATVSCGVRVKDDFLVVLSRDSDTQWRAGLRKVKSSNVAPSLDAGIDVGFARPKDLQALVAAGIDGFLGAPLDQVEAILAAASLESLGPVERRVARFLLARLGLQEAFATIETLRARVREIQERIPGVIEEIVKTRIALSFTYEYNRISTRTNLLQVVLDRQALSRFHASLVRAHAGDVVAAIQQEVPGVGLELYLNQTQIDRTHSWGFTLGIGKWARIGGKDFKQLKTVRREDVAGRVQESYLGVRSYTGRWIDQTSGWGVDLKADMKDYASEPRLVDYSYGIHVHWTSEQRSLSGEELEEWLDSGLVWRVIGERDVVHLRASLAAALSRKATLTLHVVVPNGALRSMLPALADARPEAYTRPLALAMPWMEMFEERRSAPRRRDAYAPLWAMYLEDPSQSRSVYAAAAEAHLAKQGATALAHREAQAGDPDPFTFAGLTAINGDTRGACDAFTRGARILREAILSGARNQKTIDKVFGAMNDLWAQSHHVRAVGAYLLDCAEAASVLHEVTRTLTVEADGLPDMIVVTA